MRDTRTTSQFLHDLGVRPGICECPIENVGLVRHNGDVIALCNECNRVVDREKLPSLMARAAERLEQL